MDPTPSIPAEPRDSFAPVYLRELEVRGLGGIAQATTLEFTPGPGLTVVLGRNGAGKSSFVDAVELLLTNRCARSTNVHGWRNLDRQPLPRVRGRFMVASASASASLADSAHAAGDSATIDLVREWFVDDLEANELRVTLIAQPLEASGFIRDAERIGPQMFVRSAPLGLTALSESESQMLALRQQLARIHAEPSRLRFVILDDPAPALDPEGVAALAQLLAELAQDHQVVAFTRDPRLVDAIEQLVPAVGVRVLRISST